MASRDYDDNVRRQPGRWDSDTQGQGQQHGQARGESRGGYGSTHPNQGSCYGQGSSGWGSHWDPDYHQWREEQMRNLDNDYHTWRQERYKKFSEEFNSWRNSRSGGQGQAGTGAGSSGTGSGDAGSVGSTGSSTTKHK